MWFAYVVNRIMENCKLLCKEQCRGCQQNWKSAFLHQHEQLSLLEKIEKYLDPVRGNFLGVELDDLFVNFTQNENITTARKKELIDQTRSIILNATPQSLYYGRWMTVEYELIFRDMFVIRRQKRLANKNTSDIQQSSIRRKRRRLDCRISKPHLQNAAKESVDSDFKKLKQSNKENTSRNPVTEVKSLEHILREELDK